MTNKQNHSADDSKELSILEQALKAGTPHNLYLFYGEEHYLLENYLSKLREVLIPDGTGTFNHHRFDAQGFSLAVLSETIDLLPVFSERTLIEVKDYDIYKAKEDERDQLQTLLTSLPDYVCLVFIYDTIPYSPDKRLKLYKTLQSFSHAVNFPLQPSSKLNRWIQRHVKEAGCEITPADAEYLNFMTGGQMTALSTEIPKLCSFCQDHTIVRSDIDACVTPAVEAAAFKLADAIIAGDYKKSAVLLGDICQLQESPQKVLTAIYQTMRNVLYARLALNEGRNLDWLMKKYHFARDFQAKNAMAAARKVSTEQCCNMVLLCCEAALKANSGGEDKDTAMISLLADLCGGRKADLLC